jgi:hypothetical protein
VGESSLYPRLAARLQVVAKTAADPSTLESVLILPIPQGGRCCCLPGFISEAVCPHHQVVIRDPRPLPPPHLGPVLYRHVPLSLRAWGLCSLMQLILSVTLFHSSSHGRRLCCHCFHPAPISEHHVNPRLLHLVSKRLHQPPCFLFGCAGSYMHFVDLAICDFEYEHSPPVL